jgi:hypothetical protein
MLAAKVFQEGLTLDAREFYKKMQKLTFRFLPTYNLDNKPKWAPTQQDMLGTMWVAGDVTAFPRSHVVSLNGVTIAW